jgi:Asp-tRNA(Asn)/Glu-tRNA(Gln) amidotransferase C subunit
MNDTSDIDVARVCELANIALDPAELPRFQEQMAKIVECVRKSRGLEVDGI